MRNYFETRWAHLRDCAKHAQKHWVAVVVMGLFVLYNLLTTWGPIVVLPRWMQQEHWPKIPFSIFVILLLVGLSLTLLEGSYRLHHYRPDVSAPRIYPMELIDRRKSVNPHTAFLLKNQGGGVAHNVRIQPLKLSLGEISFGEKAFIGVGEQDEFITKVPVSGGGFVFARHSLFYALNKEWEHIQGAWGDEPMTINIAII